MEEEDEEGHLRLLRNWLVEEKDLKEKAFSFKTSTEFFIEEFKSFCKEMKLKVVEDKNSKPYLQIIVPGNEKMKKVEQKYWDLKVLYAETFAIKLMGDDPLVNIWT